METNRDYFSWSQYYLWKSSKLQFYKRYVLGEDSPKLPAFEKGKEFANYKETKEIPTYVRDPLLKQVGDSVPECEIMEHELKATLSEYNLLAYLDSCEIDLTLFDEYKTGKNPWTQKMVNEHEQLDFYALCIYIKSGETILPKARLTWIETEWIEMTDGSKELRYTGHHETFEKQFTEDDMVNMMTKIVTVLNEIKEYEFKELELDDNKVNRYIKLDALEKKIKDEKNIIKLEILNLLKESKIDYGVGTHGKFSVSKRKTHHYSAELKQKEAKYKEEIDGLKKEEKDSGKTTISTSETLLFKLIKKK